MPSQNDVIVVTHDDSQAGLRAGRSRGTVPSKRRQHLVAITLFAVLSAAFFFPVIFQGKSFSTVRNVETIAYPWQTALKTLGPDPSQSDQADLSYPWQVELTRAVHQGTIPLWNPDAFVGGYPLYSNGSSAQLYPLHLLGAYFLSPTRAHDLMCVAEVFLAGVLTYLLLRELECGFWGSMLSGVTWMFCTFNLAWLQFEVVSPVQVLLPLNLLLVRRAWRRSTWGSTLLAGAALGVTMLSGHVLWMAMTCAVAGTYAVALSVRSAWAAFRAGETAAARRFLALPVAMAVVAVGVSSVELLPLVSELGISQRQAFTYSQLTHFIPGEGVSGIASPSVLGHLFFPFTTRLTISGLNADMVFAGTLPAALAIVGVFCRRPGTALGRWLLIGFALAAVGGPVTWIAYHAIPLFRIFWPYDRLFQWSSMGLAILGGIGLDETLKALARSRGRTPRFRHLAVFGVGTGVVALTAIQMIPIGLDLNPPFSSLTPATTFPATGLVRAMETYSKHTPWPARILPVSSISDPLQGGLMLSPGNYGLIYGLDLVGGYDSVIPQRTVAVARFLEGVPTRSLQSQQSDAFWLFPLDTKVPYADLARFGISAMATLPKFTVAADWGGAKRKGLPQSTLYAGQDGNLIGIDAGSVGPRVVTRTVWAKTAISALQTFVAPDFNWRQSVVLESRQRDQVPKSDRTDVTSSASPTLHQRVSDVVAGINTITMTVHTNRAGLLVVPENWEPGWAADVNGSVVPDMQGNYVQQVIPVGAGTSRVVLRYRPPGFELGALVSVITITVVVAVIGVELRRRRRPLVNDRHHDLEQELVGEQLGSDAKAPAFQAEE
jgi:hypothetical protein